MDLFGLMRMFTIKVRMLGAIAVVLVLLGILGGRRHVWHVPCLRSEPKFFEGPFPAVAANGAAANSLAQVRGLEKDMIIQYEQPDQLEKTHANWQAGLKQVRAAGEAFVAGAPEQDVQALQKLLQHLEQYEQFFTPVARQLLANGYDSATVAQRVSRRASAEFDGAEKQLQSLMQLLQEQAQAAEARGSQVATETQWLFILALVITTLVVAPLTLLNMVSICRPLQDAKRLADSIAKGDLTEQLNVVGRTKSPTCKTP